MAETGEPLTPLEENIPRESVIRDSIITYSTDVIDSTDIVDSSVVETQTIETETTNKNRSVIRDNGTPFYRKKRFWGICIAVNVLLLAILLPLFFFVIFPAIAQKIINHSNLELTSVNITNPKEDSFILSSTGNIKDGGTFNSKLEFKTPITLYWDDNELGTVEFDPIVVKGGKSEINLLNKEFTITKAENLVNFTKALMAQESINMSFKGSVSVKAMGISKGGLTLNKKVTLAGVNHFGGGGGGGNFGGTNITELKITQPNDHSLEISITAELNNPSVFSMTLGTVGIASSYNGTLLANLVIPDFNLVPGNLTLKMSGNVTPPITPEDYVNLETFMSSYIANIPLNSTSTVLYSHPDHVNNIEWLTTAVNGTEIIATIGNSPNGSLKLITGLDFGSLALNFTKESPFVPLISLNNASAQYKSPFDIKMKMVEASQNITLYSNNTAVATMVTDFFPVNDDGSKLTFSIPPLPLNVTSNEAFESFVRDLTLLPQVTVNVTGQVGIVTEIIIGNLTLKGIPFTINSTLEGFSGFQTVTPDVKNVSLVGGTKDYLIVQITTDLTNPTNVSLSTGNVNFQLSYNNNIIGNANTSLSLAPGSNELIFNSNLDPTHNVNAQEVLSNFMKGQNSTVTLQGYDGSTDIESLKLAMSSLKISAPLPGSTFQMITDASINVLNTTTTGATVTSSVSMANPFVASINILSIDSNVTAQGYFLGRILQDRSNDPIILPGHGTATASDLPFSINLDPATMFGLLRKQAQLVNLDTTVIDALITLGKINVPGVPSVTTIPPEKLKDFDIKAFVEKALANIESNVTLLSIVKVGDYVMPFAYSQIVTAHTDSSIVKLIPILSRPIVQALVDASTMNFQKLLIKSPTEDSFVTVITGQINNTGPLPATISFPNGASLISDGTTLGTMSLPPITAQENHADLNNIQSNFKILNKGALAANTAKVLLTDSITWTIAADNLVVSALQIDIPGITMHQVVELKGGSGYKDDVKINNYTLPGDAPNGGISTVIDSTLTNPSTVGVELGTVTFDVLSENIKIGEVTSSGLTIAPAGPTEITLTGRLIPQTGKGLEVMAKIFAAVLAGQPVPVTTKPTGLKPTISWLATALIQLSFDSNLPPIKLGKLIPSVDIDEMTMTFTPTTAFDPITSSKEIKAQLNMPFGFTLNIKKLSEDITLVNDGTNMAKLSIPEVPAKTENKTTIISAYENIPLLVFDDAHDSFKSFVKDLTLGDSKKFALNGSTNALANTPIGEIPMKNIPLDVPTSLVGLKGFNDKPIKLSDMDITSGTTTVLTIVMTSSIFNPSVITISTGNVNFDLIVNDTSLGTVVMKDFKLVPGDNNITTQVLFSLTSLAAPPIGQKLFENFIMNQTQLTTIVGSQSSTDVESLKDAMSALKIKVNLPGLGKQLLQSSYLIFQSSTIITQKALGGFTIANPFTATVTISKIITSKITFHGLPLASIDNVEAITVVPGKSTVKSKPMPITVFLDPKGLVKIIKLAAADAKIDITPLLPLLDLLDPPPPPPSSSPQRRNAEIATRDITPIQLLIEILNSLHVDIDMSIITEMDKYQMPLDLTLKHVPNILDDSVNILIESIATGVTQTVVTNSIITVGTAFISEEQENSFKLHMNGSITNIGKIEATITFPSGLKVTSDNKELGISKMPPVTADGSGKAVINNDSKFAITNVVNFAEFTGALMSQKSANWTLAANDVKVDAFGITIKNINLNKEVGLLGFNGLSDANVTKFNITGGPNDSLVMLIDIDLGNPSNVGIDLGTIVFNVFAGDELVGPISATGVKLLPLSVNKISFTGEIVIKDYTKLLELLQAIQEGKVKTTAHGVSVKPPGSIGDVPWLLGPFTHLILSVPLPKTGPTNPISDITIEDLDILFTPETAFNPESSSKNITTKVNLPPIPLVSASQTITILDGDSKIASLDIPDSPIDVNGNIITSSYTNVPMKALDNGAFELFLQQLTVSKSKSFTLAGSIIAKTKDQTLPSIPFKVQSSLKGLQALKSAPVTLSNLFISGASADGISISLAVKLTNPSNVQVGVGDVSFDISYSGELVGSTTIKNLVLTPGSQDYAAIFLFAPKTPDAGKAGADLLGNFLTSKDSPLQILGNKETTKIESLLPTFQFLSLGTTLNGLPTKILNAMEIDIGEGKQTGTISMNITNALNIGYLITGMTSILSSDGKELGKIDVPESLVKIEIKALSQQTISDIPFTLTGDLPNEKEIKVDIDATVNVDINGFKGPVHFTEADIPTTIKSSSSSSPPSTASLPSTASPSLSRSSSPSLSPSSKHQHK